jgi:hypothetical protein
MENVREPKRMWKVTLCRKRTGSRLQTRFVTSSKAETEIILEAQFPGWIIESMKPYPVGS